MNSSALRPFLNLEISYALSAPRPEPASAFCEPIAMHVAFSQPELGLLSPPALLDLFFALRPFLSALLPPSLPAAPTLRRCCAPLLLPIRCFTRRWSRGCAALLQVWFSLARSSLRQRPSLPLFCLAFLHAHPGAQPQPAFPALPAHVYRLFLVFERPRALLSHPLSPVLPLFTSCLLPVCAHPSATQPPAYFPDPKPAHVCSSALSLASL